MKHVRTLFSVLWLVLLGLALTYSIHPATVSAQAPVAGPISQVRMVALQGDHIPVRIPAPASVRTRAPATATFNVTFLAAGSFDDFGALCQAWDAAAMNAFQYATQIWGTLLNSSVPIRVNACWANLGDPQTLGYSWSYAKSNFTNAPLANTYYQNALADALANANVDNAHQDIYATFNTGFAWYKGTDGNTPFNQYDFVSVVMHEIGHGLGFAGSMDYNCNNVAGQGCWGYGGSVPFIYDRFIENGSRQKLLTSFANYSTQLGNQLVSNNLYFNGTNANAANSGVPAKIYAPSTWTPGSSYAHLDWNTYGGNSTANVNRMMRWAIYNGDSIHNPGPVTMGIFKDLGWQIASACFTLTTSISPANAGSINKNPAPNCNNGTQYNDGTVVQLTASANGGYTFFGWAGDAGGSNNPVSVTLNANRNVTASFNPTSFTPQYRFLPFVIR